MDAWTDRVAFITGAGSGIGAACARRFVDEGATVAGFDLQDPADGHPLAGFWALDVRDEAAIAAAVGAAVAEVGAPTVLVNAAGVSGTADVVNLDEAEWDRIVDINLKGTYLVSKHVVPHLVGGRHGLGGQPGQHRGAGGPARPGRLQRLEGRRRAADPEHGHRLRTRRGAGQLPLPRLHRDPDDRGAAGRRASRRSGTSSSPCTSSVGPASPRRWPPPRCSWPPTTPRSSSGHALVGRRRVHRRAPPG